MKFIVNISGSVETTKHRTMEVWAKSEVEAIEKAELAFRAAINKSKSTKDTLKITSVEIQK